MEDALSSISVPFEGAFPLKTPPNLTGALHTRLFALLTFSLKHVTFFHLILCVLFNCSITNVIEEVIM